MYILDVLYFTSTLNNQYDNKGRVKEHLQDQEKVSELKAQGSIKFKFLYYCPKAVRDPTKDYPKAMQEDMPSETTTKNKNEKEKRERRKERRKKKRKKEKRTTFDFAVKPSNPSCASAWLLCVYCSLVSGGCTAASRVGPLAELPDWSYGDGRPAPPMKGQLRRKGQREKFARRVVLLSQEMDAGLQVCQLRQQKLQEEERKQQHALKPKGALLQTPRPSQ
eukprot:bmy_22124T0